MTGGLQRFDPTRRIARTYQSVEGNAKTLPANGVMALYEDRQGDLWVGTFGGGLARIAGDSGAVIRYPFGGADALSDPRASAIAEDARGNLWIGTAGGGLNLLDRQTGRFHHYRRNDRDPNSLSDDAIYALHVDRHGDLWIGTAGGGLDRMIGSSEAPDAVRFENQSGVAGMTRQVVYGVESDIDGRLWLSTNNGLTRFDPRTRTSQDLPRGARSAGRRFQLRRSLSRPRRHAVLRRQQRLQRVCAERRDQGCAAAARGADLGRQAQSAVADAGAGQGARSRLQRQAR